MNPERYKRVDQVFQQALSQPPESVQSFLREACGGDESLRKEVASLLAQAGKSEGLFDSPALEVAAMALAKEQTPQPQPDLTGHTLSHYRILEKIGEGGMGVVYRAEDARLKRSVAIKLLPSDRVSDPERKRRFVKEARAASALNHPNIVTIHDIDQTEGIDFIAMEYVPGQTLDRQIPEKGMPIRRVLEIGIQIADAMAAAHSAGIIHRDLKPSNVMLSDGGQVKILDFGLAKLVEQAASGSGTNPEAEGRESSLTEEGMILGTATYMSPEQAQGKPVDARSDIFSFGAARPEGARPGPRPELLSGWAHAGLRLLRQPVHRSPCSAARLRLPSARESPADHAPGRWDLRHRLDPGRGGLWSSWPVPACGMFRAAASKSRRGWNWQAFLSPALPLRRWEIGWPCERSLAGILTFGAIGSAALRNP